MYFDKGFDTFNLNKVFYPLMKKVILSVRGVSGFLKVGGGGGGGASSTTRIVSFEITFSVSIMYVSN